MYSLCQPYVSYYTSGLLHYSHSNKPCITNYLCLERTHVQSLRIQERKASHISYYWGISNGRYCPLTNTVVSFYESLNATHDTGNNLSMCLWICHATNRVSYCVSDLHRRLHMSAKASKLPDQYHSVIVDCGSTIRACSGATSLLIIAL
jgi:hypothetical protein